MVKTLVSVSKHAHADGAAAPRAVAEVFDARQVPIAHGAYDGEAAILHAELDPGRVTQGKFDLDVTGHYGRPDIFGA